MLYSPLEQFEPIPFITLFLGNINFSLTSISIMCIFLIFILVFLIHGYVLKPLVSEASNVIQEKDGFKIKNTSQNLTADTDALVCANNKEIAFMSYLANSYKEERDMTELKSDWISSPLSGSLRKSTYAADFYENFYIYLKNEKMNKIMKKESFVEAFIINSVKLNNNFNIIKGNQSLYGLISKSRADVYKNTFIPKVNLFFFEALYTVILDMVKNTIGTDRKSVSFFPILFTLFLFILISNISGLIPYGSTITAYLIITFTMSTMVMIAVTLYSFKGHGIKFFGHFLPGGTPGWLIPFLIPIEILSFVFRVVSLAVRLFANMMAGHTLLAVLAGFGWSMITGSIFIALVSPAPVLVVFVLVGLETAVALIQAYVFTILTCIYIEESINIH